MIDFNRNYVEDGRSPEWHVGFLEILPGIQCYLEHAFRFLDDDAREEAVAESVAKTAVAYVRLFERGKAEKAFPTVLGRYAAAQTRDGRCVGGTPSTNDIMTTKAQQRHGYSVERLSYYDKETKGWTEAAVEDRTTTPADVAAFRIDFEEWLRMLPRRDYKIAMRLLDGFRVGEIAQEQKVSSGRISQVRSLLRESWNDFQGEVPRPEPYE